MAIKPNSKKQAKNVLSDLDATEVSIVPEGKNLRRFLITKSKEDEEEPMDEILKILEGKFENEADVEEVLKEGKLSPEQQKAIKGAVRLLSSVKGSVPKDVMKKLGGMVGMASDADKETKDSMKKELLVELKKEGYEIKQPEKKEPKMDPEVKARLDAIQKENSEKIDKLSEENKDLKETLSKERDLRVTKELEDKAASFGYRGEQITKIAKQLKIAKEHFEEDAYKELEEVLKEAAPKNKPNLEILKEIGKEGSGEGKGYEDKMKVKKEELRKEHPGLTDAQLEDKAIELDPALYQEYLDANPAQGGY